MRIEALEKLEAKLPAPVRKALDKPLALLLLFWCALLLPWCTTSIGGAIVPFNVVFAAAKQAGAGFMVDAVYSVLSLTTLVDVASMVRNLTGLLAFGVPGFAIGGLWVLYGLTAYVLSFPSSALAVVLTPPIARVLLTLSTIAVTGILISSQTTPGPGVFLAMFAALLSWTKSPDKLKRS